MGRKDAGRAKGVANRISGDGIRAARIIDRRLTAIYGF